MARTVVRLMGGLGNQMFQYAAGRVVAERTGTELLLDATFIKMEDHRTYQLDRLGLDVAWVDHDLDVFTVLNDFPAEDEYARERFGATALREDGHDFHDQLRGAPADSYLIGYWQSEKNFIEMADAMRAELTPKILGPKARSLMEEISAEPAAVALHVRRGDYADNPVNLAYHGLMGRDWYYAAAEQVADRVASPCFFVFSDDPDWCRENLELPGPSRIVSGETNNVEDLALIATCRHVVLPNSSFSWWGGWLAEGPGSVIVSTSRWFDEAPLETKDKVPDRWLMV